ncbi:hypothetical protein CTI12_AA037310 [Artemisia annua]|uniref:Uncharacterized protein n=1 Tax=Artemisia annua TaxID=35608 RepID=A0A2U1QF91_ARTAN|nr:hypothetical protein CTI12_AA037310 [Artemisia annua]
MNRMAEPLEERLSIEEVVYMPTTNTPQEWLNSILKAKSTPSCQTQIHKVPMILKEHKDHDKYYVPKVVSLGPYHYGNPNLESVQNFKPLFTNKLLKENRESIQFLYDNLAELAPELRGYYEDEDDRFSDDEFTRMMLLDGCFILYFIKHIFMNDETDSLEMKSHQIMFVQQDMFLLENQIPYLVLIEVMKLVPDKLWDFKITRFIDDNILATERRTRTREHTPPSDPIPTNINHLLQLLQTRLTKDKTFGPRANDRYTFRNVNELIEVGIRFTPSKIRSLAHIKFIKHGFCANVELPPITIDDATKPMLLNLVAYEMCSNDTNASWVTSYICLMDSLIDHSEDVKFLRKAGILDNRLGSDKEVARLFNEIGTDLVPNNFAYSNARFDIQRHYDSKRNTLISQLKHEYIKTPWAFVALFVGVVGLFLSGVQSYFSVWGVPSPCDSLCLSLKMNHHL